MEDKCVNPSPSLFAICSRRRLPLQQTRTAKTLDVYLIDVEGGGARLFVSPSGESVLIGTATAARPRPGTRTDLDAVRTRAHAIDNRLSRTGMVITTVG
jgi:hypothetical protein